MPVRCPATDCGEVFEVPERTLGRSVNCPACGVRLTARPLEIERKLRDQQRRVRGEAGAPLPRLPLVVVVDNVRSLWNVGSMFRTADACGVRKMVLTGITGCPPRDQIAKTALGAEQAVAWSYRADPLEAVRQLHSEQFVSVAVETSGRAVSLDDFDWPGRCCLVIGNEVSGVTPSVLDACEHHVSIPMLGVKQTLNVAVAFGIAAYRAAGALRSTCGAMPDRVATGEVGP